MKFVDWTFYFQEEVLLDTMFDVPGSDITKVTVTKAAVLGLESPLYTRCSDEKTTSNHEDSLHSNHSTQGHQSSRM